MRIWSRAASRSRCSPTAGRAARSSPRAIWRSKAFTSTARSRCGASRSATGPSSSGSGWSPAPNTVYVAWRLEGEAGEAAHLSVALLANGRDHHGDTWPPVSHRRSLPTAARLTVTVADRFALDIAASGGADRGAPRVVSRFRSAGRARARARRQRLAPPCRRSRHCRWPAGKWGGFAAEPRAPARHPISTPRSNAAARTTGRCCNARSPPTRSLPRRPAGSCGWCWRPTSICIARPLPRLPGRALGDRRLSVVRRLGPRHDDLAARAVPRDRPVRHGAADPRNLRPLCRSRHAAERLSRRRRQRPNTTPPMPSLWYIEAWRAYVEATGDEAALRRVFPVLAEIVDWHVRGTRYGIAVDPGGRAAARRRTGRAADLDGRQGRRLGGHAAHRQAGRDQRAVVQRADRDGGDGRTDRLAGRAPIAPAAERRSAGFARFALAGRRRPLRRHRRARTAPMRACGRTRFSRSACRRARSTRRSQRAVLDALRQGAADLVRSALAGAERARPIAAACTGGRGRARRRLSPGHRLGVAAWAMGAGALPGPSATRRRRSGSWSRSATICADAGLGQVSEIFDGDAPHTPRGCPAQAWSVACVLEAWWRLERAKSAVAAAGPAHALLIRRSGLPL